jgi:glycerophosphoryl diester phosphodiesterase
MILLDVGARVIVGHRGASADYPENTLLAFEQALAQGAHALEFDVRLAGDGVPVVIHDATLDRTTDATGPVAAIPSTELTQVNAGSGQAVSTLDDVLEHVGDVPIIVEVKETVAAGATAECLERHAAAGRAVVGSFESQALEPFRRRSFHCASSRWETATAFVASRFGMRGPGRYEAFTIPEHHGRLHLVDRRFVVAARRARRPVHVWTVNDAQQARQLWSIGVSGIITNEPAKMRALLEDDR